MTKIKRICVKDVMKTDYGTIDGGATIKEALNEMNRLKTTVLIINKRPGLEISTRPTVRISRPTKCV